MPTAFSSLALCEPRDVYSRVNRDGLGQLVSASGQGLDAIVQEQIDLNKDDIRKRLIKLFKDSYPTTVDRWITFSSYAINQTRNRLEQALRSRGLEELLPSDIGTLVNDPDFIFNGFLTRPAQFLNHGAPTNGASGTEAGNAANGSILIDTVNWAVYQNKGTLAVPAWTLWDPKGFVDCILNPTELKTPNVTGTILALYENGSLIDNGQYSENLKAYEDTKKRLTKKYAEDLELALSILDVDASGDGLLSDFEKSRVSEFDYGFS
jgi:hypothetical protein